MDLALRSGGSGFSNAQFKELAGNAFSANVFVAIYVSLLATLPDMKESIAEVHDVDSLLRLSEFMKE